MNFLKIILVLVFVLFVAGILYFTQYENQTDSKSTDVNSAEMVSYQLPEDGSPLLTFKMPSNYEPFEKGITDTLSFRADTYTVEPVTKEELSTSSSETNSLLLDVDVPGNGLKRCIESSNGMSVDIQMLGGLNPLPSDEFIQNVIASNENSAREIKTSTETIDGRAFVRSEQVQPECEYSYAVTHAASVDGYLAQFNFRFEGDYVENLAIIERVIDSVEFK
ncbi:hypothetical protein GVX82_03645 [Patescibacteria group bacterium]|jgi:hypothetical protein|nr:hypothetical protein [Patescibacteria group bacterium]